MNQGLLVGRLKSILVRDHPLMTSRCRGGEGGCQKHDVVREVA